MSLILDALRKLERQKDVTEPSVVLVGAVPWQGLRRARVRPRLLLALLAGLCGVGLLWGTWHARTTPGSSENRPALSPSATVAPASAPVVRGTTAGRHAQQAETAGGRSGAASATNLPGTPPTRTELRLNAISEQGGRPVALVNDRLVREGDSFDGVRIVRIGAAEVEVEIGGKRRLLTF